MHEAETALLREGNQNQARVHNATFLQTHEHM